MRNGYLICGLIAGATLLTAQNSNSQYNRAQNDPNYRNGSTYPTYDERNYANNQWRDTIPAGTEVRVRTDQAF